MIEWLKRALRRQPARAAAGKDSDRPGPAGDAFACHASGDWQRAVLLLEPLAKQYPDDARILYRLGDALFQLGRAPEALPHLQRATALSDDEAEIHYKLGNVLLELERLDGALSCYQRALEREPRHARSLANTGVIRETQGRVEDAIDCYRGAIDADGGLLPARRNLAALLQRSQRFEESENVYRGLLERDSASALDWGNLGKLLHAQHRYDDALDAYERALQLDRAQPEFLNNIGTIHQERKSLQLACRYFEQAIAVAPEFTLARLNLAVARLSMGLSADATSAFREVLAFEPQNVHAARYVLLSLLYQHIDADALFAEHVAFGRRFAPGKQPATFAGRATGTARRLRVGYVSSDLYSHPVGYNLLPIIEHHDRNAFEVLLYADVAKPDHVTRWYREHATWRVIDGRTDEDVARMIREDSIDILVLLAGRFDANRPLIATYRPAPIQVSFHDPATSGLDDMDYLIADRTLVPRRTTERFTERVVCLPTFYIHPPLTNVPPPTEPPSARKGGITFGSFNKESKVGPDVVALWSRVLHAAPGSRLLLKHMATFSIPDVRSRYAALFREHGVGEERLIFPDESEESRGHHLARYAQIDIALDPFPFTGSTTTFEALWMGVPVVTLLGERMVGRWSAAMLRKVGLAHLIARDESQYVEIARALAADPAALARLRRELRERVARSPLCAERARTRQLERLYRRMWAIWVARNAAGS